MGEFKSGIWIFYLILYFVAIIFITMWTLNLSDEYNLNNENIHIDSGGLFTSNINTNNNLNNISQTQYSADSKISLKTFMQSISFLSGLNSNNNNLGTPSSLNIYISLFIFWIPGILLLWAVYMALPFMH